MAQWGRGGPQRVGGSRGGNGKEPSGKGRRKGVVASCAWWRAREGAVVNPMARVCLRAAGKPARGELKWATHGGCEASRENEPAAKVWANEEGVMPLQEQGCEQHLQFQGGIHMLHEMNRIRIHSIYMIGDWLAR